MPLPASVRNFAKEVRARASGLGLGRASTRHPWLILCYHRVVPVATLESAPFPGICVRDDVFADQVAYLTRHFEVVTLREGAERFIAGDHDRALACITFDDGYADNHDVAAPILAAHRVPATVFAVADFIDSGRALWFDTFALRARDAAARGALDALVEALDEPPWQAASGALRGRGPIVDRARAAVAALKRVSDADRLAAVERATELVGPNPELEPRLRLMTWSELRALADAGWEVGSHSATHAILTGLNPVRLAAEVAGSRHTLESGLGGPVTSFCYPNGDFDDSVVDAVRAGGYACGVTAREEPNDRATDRHRFRRVYVGPRTGVGFGGRFSNAVFTDALLRSGR